MEESNKRAERGAPAAHLSRDRTGQCDTIRYCGLNIGPPVRSPGGWIWWLWNWSMSSARFARNQRGRKIMETGKKKIRKSDNNQSKQVSNRKRGGQTGLLLPREVGRSCLKASKNYGSTISKSYQKTACPEKTMFPSQEEESTQNCSWKPMDRGAPLYCPSALPRNSCLQGKDLPWYNSPVQGKGSTAHAHRVWG